MFTGVRVPWSMLNTHGLEHLTTTTLDVSPTHPCHHHNDLVSGPLLRTTCTSPVSSPCIYFVQCMFCFFGFVMSTWLASKYIHINPISIHPPTHLPILYLSCINCKSNFFIFLPVGSS